MSGHGLVRTFYYYTPMKKTILLALLLCSTTYLLAQNLIRNSDFEEHDCSVTEYSPLYYQHCKYWTYPYWGSAYLSPYCHDPIFTDFTPPNMRGDYQAPHSGRSFVGFNIARGNYAWPSLEYEAGYEYISTHLKSVLKKDSIYQLELYVNQSNTASHFEVELQALFSDTLYHLPIPRGFNSYLGAPAPIYPHKASISLTPDFFVNDTLNWTRICVSYRAKGGEQWLTIGNFDHQNEIKYVCDNSGRYLDTMGTYYYVDDVTLRPAPTATFIDLNLGRDTVLCSSALPYALSAPPNMDSYIWSTGSTAPTVSAAQAGTYWVLCHQNGCTMSDTIQVRAQAPPATPRFLGNDLVRCPTELPLTLAAPAGFSNYQWSNSSSNTATTAVAQSGIYTATVSNVCGSFTDELQVTVLRPADYQVHLGRDTALCATATVQIKLSVPAIFDSYAWSTNAITPMITANQFGIYTVAATYRCGTVRDTIAIIPKTLPTLAVANTLICSTQFPVVYNLSAVDGSVSWSTGAIGKQIAIAQAGTYQVTATNECGSTSTVFQVAAENPLPPFRLAVTDTTSCLNGQFVPVLLTAPAGYPNYIWSTNENTNSIIATQANTYTVSSENICGSVRGSIEVSNCSPNHYIPNIFTPNGDGSNDYFTLYANGAIRRISQLQIFDRYGELVFSKSDFAPNADYQGWDGSFRGQPAAADVYIYVAKVEYATGATEIYKGDMTLAR